MEPQYFQNMEAPYVVNQACPYPNYSPIPQNLNTTPISSPNQYNMPIQGYPSPLINPQNPIINYSLEETELFDDLKTSPSASITKIFEGLIFKDVKYLVKLNGAERNIFIGKLEKGLIGNKHKNFQVKMKYIPRDVNFQEIYKDKNFDNNLINIKADPAICGDPTVNVISCRSRIRLGVIKQPNICCCSDPEFQLININNIYKYRVTTDGCQCSYCCCDGCCCSEYETFYRILDSSNTQICGQISKSDCSNKEKLIYMIDFPLDATPEEKIIIIASAIVIDCCIYQMVGH